MRIFEPFRKFWSRVSIALVRSPGESENLEQIPLDVYRSLQLRLKSSSGQAGSGVLLFAAPATGEGTSTVVRNVALYLSRVEKQSVLLIDLGAAGQDGRTFRDVLEGRAGVREAAESASGGFSEMAGGEGCGAALDGVSTHDLKSCLERIRRDYKVVLVDSEPISAAAGFYSLAAQVDGVVLVLESALTPKDRVAAEVEKLRGAGADVRGIVLNKWDGENSVWLSEALS